MNTPISRIAVKSFAKPTNTFTITVTSIPTENGGSISEIRDYVAENEAAAIDLATRAWAKSNPNSEIGSIVAKRIYERTMGVSVDDYDNTAVSEIVIRGTSKSAVEVMIRALAHKIGCPTFAYDENDEFGEKVEVTFDELCACELTVEGF